MLILLSLVWFDIVECFWTIVKCSIYVNDDGPFFTTTKSGQTVDQARGWFSLKLDQQPEAAVFSLTTMLLCLSVICLRLFLQWNITCGTISKGSSQWQYSCCWAKIWLESIKWKNIQSSSVNTPPIREPNEIPRSVIVCRYFGFCETGKGFSLIRLWF